MKSMTIKCPECGATVHVEEGKNYGYCEYCGSKVLVSNENEVTYRHIDVAKMRELDLMEKEREDIRRKEQQIREDEKRKQITMIIEICVALSACILGVYLFFTGFYLVSPPMLFTGIGLSIFSAVLFNHIKNVRKKREEDKKAKNGLIKFPDFFDNNAYSLHAKLEQAGFTNVRLVNLRDITLGLIKKVGEIESISVNGIDSPNGKWFPPNSPILIQYHGRPE